MKFTIRNFRRIKEASLEPRGITLITGANSAGKSTALKALRAVLQNSISDRQIRRGQTAFSVKMEAEGQAVSFTRTKGRSRVEVTKGGKTDVLEKLGSEDLATIVPGFPLRLMRLGKTIFFPNFTFQNHIPIFSQVDMTELFSVLYDDLAKLTIRLGELKKETSLSKKQGYEIQAQLSGLDVALLGFLKQLTEARKSRVEELAPALKECVLLREQLAVLGENFRGLTESLGVDFQAQKCLNDSGLLTTAQETFARYQQAKGLKDTWESLADSRVRVEEFLSTVPDYQEDLNILERVLQTLPTASEIGRLEQTAYTLATEINSIPEPGFNLRDAESVIYRLETATVAVTGYAAALAGSTACQAQVQLFGDLDQLGERLGLVQSYLTLDELATATEDELNLACEEYETLTNQISHIQTCPVCGSAVDFSKITLDL